MSLKKMIQARGKMLGLLALGVSRADPFAVDEAIMQTRLTEGLMAAGSASDIRQRTHPEQSLPGAASIVCAAVDCRLPFEATQDHRLARFARVRDYHPVLQAAMADLAGVIQDYDPRASCRISVDTGPLVERSAAARAGLGFIGKNTSLVIPRTGSFVLLGAVLTTVDLEPDEPLKAECGDCRACLDACPTGALQSPYTLKEDICLSYLTQMKGWIPRQWRTFLKDTLWGCDRCQDVCPYNRLGGSLSPLWHPEQDRILLPSAQEMLAWDAAGYRDVLSGSALFWRGRTVLQRNVLVMLGNRQDPGDIDILASQLGDARPVIRGHGAWALGRYRLPAAEDHLHRALAHEPDLQVRAEIQQALTPTEQPEGGSP